MSADELIGVELASGDVDGHADRIPGRSPRGALSAGLLQDPLADLGDQPRLLEQRDEVVGLNDAARRVLPADQGLHPGGAHVAQVDRGLVGEEELVVLEGFAQVHLEFHAVLDGVLHAGLEHDVAVLAVPLGPVHRDVGVAQELLGRGSLPDRDPDARRHGHASLLVRSELERLLERVEQALGDQLGPGCQRELLGDHDELVPAEAPQRIGVAYHAVEPRGDRLQEFIADAVAERVVDVLEVVEVDEQRRHRRLAATRAREHLLDAVRGSRSGWAGRSARRGSPGTQAPPRAAASSSSVRWRSVSKHSHIRSRLNSRLSCRMFRASESASGETSSCVALSCSTSAITLRHQKQRQVTSFSDAARWTASSPKISQVSRPASIATSMPSPRSTGPPRSWSSCRFVRSCPGPRRRRRGPVPWFARRSARAHPRLAPSAPRRDDGDPPRAAPPEPTAAPALVSHPFPSSSV